MHCYTHHNLLLLIVMIIDLNWKELNENLNKNTNYDWSNDWLNKRSRYIIYISICSENILPNFLNILYPVYKFVNTMDILSEVAYRLRLTPNSEVRHLIHASSYADVQCFVIWVPYKINFFWMYFIHLCYK